jgi:hypothetical protein
MDQTFIDSILASQPAWASEVTMRSVNSSMQEQNINMSVVAAVLGKKDAAAIRDLVNTSEENEQEVSRLGTASMKATKIAGGAMDKIMSDSDPTNAVAELSHEAAKLLANAGIGLSNMGTGLGKFAAVMKGVARHAGTPLVVGTGLGVLFAKLLTEQEKQARSLIEFGATVSDTAHWTNLRYATRNLGMGMKDFQGVMQEAKPFIVQAEGSAFDGSLKLAEFAKAVDQDKTFRDFGMGIQDQTRFIGQEIETLFELGEITTFNDQTKKQVIRSYASANKLALFTGDVFGMQREESLRLREEARNSVDLRVALKQNKDHIDKTYGEMASENIAKANGIVYVLNTQLLGKDFADQVKGMSEGMLGDIAFDDSAANNISTNLLKTLAGAPGVSDELIGLVEKMNTNEFKTEKEIVDAYKNFYKLIKDVPMVVTAGDPNLDGDSFLQSDTDVLQSDFYANLADASDASIEVMNNLAVAFQNMQELLTPGYDTMAHGFTTLSDGLMAFGKGISRTFSGGDTTAWDEGLREFNEDRVQKRLAKVNESNITQNIQMVNMQIDSILEESKANAMLQKSAADGEMTPEILDEAGEVISGGEEFTEEQLYALKQQELQMKDNLIETKEYLAMLLEKQQKLNAKEEVGAH